MILDGDLAEVKEFMANPSPHPGKDLKKGHFGFAGLDRSSSGTFQIQAAGGERVTAPDSPMNERTPGMEPAAVSAGRSP